MRTQLRIGLVFSAMSLFTQGASAQPVAPTFIEPAADPVFCGAGGAQCDDSKWMPATNASNKTLVFNHKLGTTPRFISIVFSPTGDDSNVSPLIWAWTATHSGNPVTVQVTDKQVVLHIYSGAPLHGMWDANSGAWNLYTSGSFRVFVRK